jgi:hypothetical protein
MINLESKDSKNLANLMHNLILDMHYPLSQNNLNFITVLHKQHYFPGTERINLHPIFARILNKKVNLLLLKSQEE